MVERGTFRPSKRFEDFSLMLIDFQQKDPCPDQGDCGVILELGLSSAKFDSQIAAPIFQDHGPQRAPEQRSSIRVRIEARTSVLLRQSINSRNRKLHEGLARPPTSVAPGGAPGQPVIAGLTKEGLLIEG